MKAKLLSFPFICFSESGLFNGLQSIQIKKILRYTVAKISQVPPLPLTNRPLSRQCWPARGAASTRPAEIILAHIHFFSKQFHRNILVPEVAVWCHISPIRVVRVRPGIVAPALPEFDHRKAFESLDTNSQSHLYVNITTLVSTP
jgi:hypothetical protein